MSKRVFFLISILVSSALTLGVGCGSSGDSTNIPSTTIELPAVPDYALENTDQLLSQIQNDLAGLSLTEFFQQSFQFIEARDPEGILASSRVESFPAVTLELNNISDPFYFQTVAIKSLILELLLTYDDSVLSTANKLHFDVYRSYLEFDIGWSDYRNYEYPATIGFFGWPGATEGFFTQVLTITNKEEAETFLALLNQVERRMSQLETLLDIRAAAGIVEPNVTLSSSLNAVNALANTSATNTSYYQSFNTQLNAISGLSNAEKQQMRDTAREIIIQRVIPAYQSLSQKMTSLLSQAPSNIGFGQFSGGDAFYQYALSFFTSSDATADEIHQQGLAELERIHSEMNVLFDELGYPSSESIEQKLNRVQSDGGSIAGSQAVALFESIIAEAYTRLPEAFSTLPQQEVIVIGGNTGGYYIAGSEDGSRPGAFYAYTAGSLPYFTMPTLAYHEAVPGHHLQLALAQELDMPRFRKEVRFTSFIEGWGLYAERLASDLGWYQNDIYGEIGRLQFEAMRASRLVIDTGIHSKGWTFNQAQSFSQANIGNPGSIARYSVYPGQATAYMIGMLKILELRNLAQSQLGNNYDIKDFHDVVIGSGSMPLNILEQAVDNYINTRNKN